MPSSTAHLVRPAWDEIVLNPKVCVPVQETWQSEALQNLGLLWLLHPLSALALLQVIGVLEGILQLLQSMEVL